MSILLDQFANHRKITYLAKADVLKTYRGSALGWSWAVIKPTTLIFIYWFAFRIGLGFSSSMDGFPFLLWLIAGLAPWIYMNEMLTQGSDAISKYRYLVTKIKYPVSTIPTFVSLSKLYIHAVVMIVVMIIYALFGYFPDVYYLQLPLFMFLNFLFFTAWSLFASPISAISKDFGNLIQSFVPAVFWLSGILWNPNGVDHEIFRLILRLNPVTYLVGGYRSTFIYKEWFFESTDILIFFGVLGVMCLLGKFVFERLVDDLSDNL